MIQRGSSLPHNYFENAWENKKNTILHITDKAKNNQRVERNIRPMCIWMCGCWFINTNIQL